MVPCLVLLPAYSFKKSTDSVCSQLFGGSKSNVESDVMFQAMTKRASHQDFFLQTQPKKILSQTESG
jgi:hypothetical protein